MTEEEKKAIEDLKDILKYWQTIVEIEDDVERKIEMNCYSEEMPFEQLKIALNLIEKLKKEITNGMEREENLKDSLMEIIETLNLENNVIGQETILREIIRLQTENEELKEKVFKRDKELIRLEEYANKNFERKDDVKAKYIPKDKIKEKLERLESQKENYKEQPLIYMLLKNQLKSLIEEE